MNINQASHVLDIIITLWYYEFIIFGRDPLMK